MHECLAYDHYTTEMDLDKIRSFGHLELLARQMVEGFITGLHKSPYHGFSVEFAEHKLYNTGESTRHIDWKVFARTDRLYTRQFEEETNLRCMILLDVSSSMYYPADTLAKISFSILSSAALVYMLQRQRDAVGFCAFSDQIEFISQVKSTSRHSHYLMLEMQKQLENVPQRRQTNVSEVIHQIAEQIHRRSLVVIFSDMMEREGQLDEIFTAIQHLRHNQHEILLFHVYDGKTEKEFDFPERPIVFVDLETGQEEKVQPAQVKEVYQERVRRIYQELKIRCGQYKIEFIEADCRQDPQQILLAYLIKRAKMH